MPAGLKFALILFAPIVVFAAMVGADRAFHSSGRGANYVERIAMPPLAGAVGLPRVEGPADASRPLVVIDPGHGGHDPGAGSETLKEKDLTLALAQDLRRELIEQGGIRVALTRGDDRYLLLEERSQIARRLGADLFLSLHADSVEREEATGASVYTLSEKGTTQAAAGMAERENRADRVNGVELSGTSNAVMAILVDLSQRETQVRSTEFARLLLREAQGKLLFRPEPLQSAAFTVLKSPDVPSVLFEAGYISNADEAARLISPEGRQAFARAAARAIRVYFARQAAL